MTQTIKDGWSSTRRNATRGPLVAGGLLVALVLTLAAAVLALPAFGGHGDGVPEVSPTALNGNPNCGRYPGTVEVKVEPVADGTRTFSTSLGTVTVTLDVNEGAKSFSFDLSDNVVAAVVLVKGGPGANQYDYRPSGINHDDGLIAPSNLGLSHISFCLIVPPEPDVSVSKTPDGGTANAGSTISFTIVVTSEGNTAADGVTLSDTLPNSGLNWSITSQPSGSPCSISGTPQVLSCNFGTLAVGATRTVTISSATDAADCGVKNNTVTVSATGDIDTSNNSDTGSIEVICAAMRILKNSTKGGPVNNAGAVFAVDGPDAGTDADFSVTDDTTAAAPDEDADIGEVCVSGLVPGATYTVNETTAPTGYGAATQADVTVVAVAGGCSSTGLNAATFTNAPLGEIVIDYNDLGSNETSAKIDCGALTPTPADATPTAHDDNIETYTNLPAGNPPIVYTCTISVDP